MGHGDHPFAAYLEPPLSSVRLPAAEVGTTAVSLLLRRLGSNRVSVTTKKVRLSPSLVTRASTLRAVARG
jgi:LacI family transcriptional regulator